MMEHLPPVGWADVATKHDVEREVALLRAEMQTGFAGLRSEMHSGAAQLRAESQRVLMWTVGLMVPGFLALFAAIVARS